MSVELSIETFRKQAWEQYNKQVIAINKTIDLLKTLGVADLPNKVNESVVSDQDDMTLLDEPSTPKVPAKPLKTRILEAVESLQGRPFTRPIISRIVENDGFEKIPTPGTFAVIFHMLSKSEKWTVLQQGTGSNASVYRAVPRTRED